MSIGIIFYKLFTRERLFRNLLIMPGYSSIVKGIRVLMLITKCERVKCKGKIFFFQELCSWEPVLYKFHFQEY